MEIRIIWVGKSQRGFIADGIAEFSKRLNNYCKPVLVEIPDIKNAKNLSPLELKKKEGELILKQLKGDCFMLDENGKHYTSNNFADFIEKKQLHGTKALSFIIGGAFGFDDAVYNAVQGKISLSKMTFSHQMIRMFMLEQIYRAYTIIKGEPYHNN